MSNVVAVIEGKKSYFDKILILSSATPSFNKFSIFTETNIKTTNVFPGQTNSNKISGPKIHKFGGPNKI